MLSIIRKRLVACVVVLSLALILISVSYETASAQSISFTRKQALNGKSNIVNKSAKKKNNSKKSSSSKASSKKITTTEDVSMYYDEYVPEDETRTETVDNYIELKYDDRYRFENNVKSISNKSVSSKNVKTGETDSSVLSRDSKNKKMVIAKGCGEAEVTLDNNEKITVKVSPAKISLILMAGQSNMEGSPSIKTKADTYRMQSVLNEVGQVYNTYGPSDAGHGRKVGGYGSYSQGLTYYNASHFVPDSLTDNSSKNICKRTNNLTKASSAQGKIGMDSAFAYEWVKKTGEKVWLVNASHNGKSISEWVPTGKEFKEAVELYKRCAKVLNKEIKAGHYKLSHKGYMWMQGEQDFRMSSTEYRNKFMRMHAGFKQKLKFKGLSDYSKVKGKIEFAGVIPVRAHANPKNVKDLRMTGPRIAQYYMTSSSLPRYKDIYLSSQVGEAWYSSSTVKHYFKTKYGNNKNYKNRIKFRNASAASLPTKIKQVHATIHYEQLGYNELGFDAADNILYATGIVKKKAGKNAVIKLVSEDGITDINQIDSVSNRMIIVPKVYPTWKAKKLKLTHRGSQVSYSELLARFKAPQVIDDDSSENNQYIISFNLGKVYRNYSPWIRKFKVKLYGKIKTK
ncbi:MAG: hypothetical protein K6D02_07460 [Lachnospiraceae bacterium]|nr:hypothetical protein [Lachnospiraceae bacterium]